MNDKKYNLKDVVTYNGIYSGYSFREKINNQADGKYRVVQLKDVNQHDTSIHKDCFQVNLADVKPKHFLHSGDILFVAKGSNNFAVTFYPIDDKPTIASSAFYVIEVNREIAVPEYVTWYINQTDVQTYLKSNLIGTYAQNINKPTVEEIPIVLPNLKTQSRIAEIAFLNQKEQHKLEEIKALRNKLIQEILLKTI
jgi:restriction endonuclease S subunit